VSVALFKAEDDRSTDTLDVGMVNITADNFVTSGNAVLRFEVTKYLRRSEVLLCINSSDE
jgi:hypothetical protein